MSLTEEDLEFDRMLEHEQDMALCHILAMTYDATLMMTGAKMIMKMSPANLYQPCLFTRNQTSRVL